MQTTALAAPSPATAPAQVSARQTNALSSDFETFLKMLTVQMKNQDPLNPIESTDFAVQLATFSGVEQQVRTNDLLTDLSAALGGSALSHYAGWIGREARSSVQVDFEGSPLTLYPAGDAAEYLPSFLVVRDATGFPLSRVPIQNPNQPFVWAGVGAGGAPFPPGLYSFEIEQTEAGSVVATVAVEHYAMVREVRSDPSGAILVLNGGVAVPASGVTAVRAPTGGS
jgi:flagellar basal-body rod modification protein FlgD